MDLKINGDVTGADAVLTSNDLAVVYGIENMPFLGQFAGPTWWGNDLFFQGTDFQFSAETETILRTTTLNSEGRVTIEKTIKRDLQFLLDYVPGTTLDVQVTIQSDDRVSVYIFFNGQQFNYLWNPKKEAINASGSPTPPTCEIPTGLMVDGVTDTTASFSWTGVDTYVYRISGGTGVNITNDHVTVTGLTPNTSYSFFLRRRCGVGVVSSQISVPFTTDP